MMLAAVVTGALFALSEGAAVAIVVVVISAVIGPVVVVWATARTRKVAERAAHTLGEKPQSDDPEQSLTVVQMLQKVLEGQAGQDNRLAAHDALHAAHDRRLDEHHQRIARAEKALRRLHGDDAA